MEENVALDSKKQRKFVKSIRGIKKLIKKNEKEENKPEPKKKDEKVKPEKPFSMRLKPGFIRKKRKEKGLVYLSHIPHGFYEHQMTQYFKQFGVVTNARVIRSKRTGNSKGFAFVEFKEPSVAQIVTETMNNYLMGKRLIKAVYIEPEKQKRKAFRKHWNTVHNPTSIRRRKLKKAFNSDKDDAEELKKAKKLLDRITKTKKRLGELGINYDFFTPVDVPESLLHRIIKKEQDEDTVEVNSDMDSKINKKKKLQPVKLDSDQGINKSKKGKVDPTKVESEKENKTSKKQKVHKKDTKVDKKQDEKKIKLKEAGVKPMEEFFSIGTGDSSSDESCEFDSDEYEKMIGDDDDFSSEDGEESEEAADSESGEELPVPIQNDQKKWARPQRKAPQKIATATKKPMKKKFKKK